MLRLRVSLNYGHGLPTTAKQKRDASLFRALVFVCSDCFPAQSASSKQDGANATIQVPRIAYTANPRQIATRVAQGDREGRLAPL